MMVRSSFGKAVVAVLAAMTLTACTAPGSAQSDHLQALGFADDAGFRAAVLDVTAVLGRTGMYCGVAMTDAACEAVKSNVTRIAARDSNEIRDRVMDQIASRAEAQGGMDAFIAEERSQLAGTQGRRPCADGAADRSCQLLINSMFSGALLPTVEEARREAAKTVPQFYRDGRPFNG